MITNDMANSPQLRQMGLLHPNLISSVKQVHVFGCGGIGGPTALIVAKMGFKNIFLYDKDHVEPHNIGSQMFGYKDIGQEKTIALAEHMKNLIGHNQSNIIPVPGDILETFDYKIATEQKSIIILALDSNDVRAEIYEYILSKFGRLEDILIIDPRMGGLSYTVIAKEINQAQDEWKKYTPMDSAVPDDVCTERAISFNTFSIAAEIGAIIRLWLNDRPLPLIERCMNNCVLLELNQIYKQ